MGHNLEKTGVIYIGGEVIESPYVGGRKIEEDPPYHIIVNQTMVDFYVPENPSDIPLIMLPGYGLSGYIYKATPDGRNGWAVDFAKKGYRTYVQSPHDMAVSGMNINLFNDVKNGKITPGELPDIIGYAVETAWKLWGIGNRVNEPYEDAQFPSEHMHQFCCSYSPVMQTDEGIGKPGNFKAKEKEISNMIEFLEYTGPAVLFAHSMSGVLAYEITRRRPDLVKGIIAVEPVGSPTDEDDVEKHFKEIPYLVIYGDYIDIKGQRSRLDACIKTAELICSMDGRAKVIELPDMGIKGNSHVLMVDKNSSEIAQIIQEWMQVSIF